MGETREIVFDRDDMLERLGGDVELLREVVELFQEESSSLLARVGDAISSRDARQIRSSAHTMKGALLNMAASRASRVASELEQLGERGEIDACTELFSSLEAEIERLGEKLRQE